MRQHDPRAGATIRKRGCGVVGAFERRRSGLEHAIAIRSPRTGPATPTGTPRSLAGPDATALARLLQMLTRFYAGLLDTSGGASWFDTNAVEFSRRTMELLEGARNAREQKP